MLTVILEAAFRSLLMALAVWTAIRLLRVRAVLPQKVAWVLVLVAAGTMPLVMHLPGLTMARAVKIPVHPFERAKKAAPETSTVRVSLTQQAVADYVMPMKSSGTSLKTYIPARKTKPSRLRDRLASASEILPALGAPVALSVPADELASAANPMTFTVQTRRSRWSRVMDWITWAHIRSVLVGLYLAVVGVFLLRSAAGLWMAFRIWRGSQTVSEVGMAMEGSAALRVRVSPKLSTPVTIGSTILLPHDYTSWDETKLRIVLAHEQSHVRQKDFYLQLVASVYAAIFWFSPLGWWLKRKLSELGEALSDRAGLAEAQNASSYAEVLLEFAAMPRTTPLAGVAMARSSNLSSRMERILNARNFRLAFSSGRGHAVLSAILVPVALLAAIACIRIVPGVQAAQRIAQAKPANVTGVVPPAQASAGVTAQAPAPQQPATDAVSGQASEDVAGQVTDVDVEPVAPAVAGAPVMPVAPVMAVAPAAPMIAVMPPTAPSGKMLVLQAPVAPAAPQGPDTVPPPPGKHGPHMWVYHDDDDGDAFSIVHDNGDGTLRWQGEYNDDLAQARKKLNLKGDYIWFERDGKSYVITDPAIIAQSKELFRPDPHLQQMKSQLDAQRALLNKQMGEMNAKMSLDQLETPEFKAKMAHLNQQLADLQGEKMRKLMDEINAKVAKATADMNQAMKSGHNLTSEQLQEFQSDRIDKLSELQSERMERLGDLQGKIGEIQGQIGELQGELGEKRGEWGEKQGELGEKMGELGEKMGQIGEEEGRKAEEASRKMKPLLDQAIKDGRAKPVE